MNTDCLSQPAKDCGDQDEPGSSAEGEGPPERASRPTSQTIDIISDAAPAALLSRLHANAQAVIPMLPRRLERVAVRLADDETMATLHATWCGRDGTTDVITFESSPDGDLCADIAIGLNVAERVADERGHSLDHELTLYLIHGLLHCCGWNDQTPAEANSMRDEQDRILKAIGLDQISQEPDS